MASITKKPNGSYVIRFPAGKDFSGKYVTISRVFWPSTPGLSYKALQKELHMFIESTESQIAKGELSAPNSVPNDQKKTTFETFCKLYLDIKNQTLAPGTLSFYKKVIDEHLIPMYGKVHMEDFTVKHVQDYIQFSTGLLFSHMMHKDQADLALICKCFQSSYHLVIS